MRDGQLLFEGASGLRTFLINPCSPNDQLRFLIRSSLSSLAWIKGAESKFGGRLSPGAVGTLIWSPSENFNFCNWYSWALAEHDGDGWREL